MKTIQLRDKSTIVVENDRAERIKKAIDSGAIGVDIDNDWIRCDFIVRIKQSTQQETLPESHQLDQPDYRGQGSPAKEHIRQELDKKDSLTKRG